MCSVGSAHIVKPIRVSRSRPGSAREWFEAYNRRRNEEFWRMEEWKNTVDMYKKWEWDSQYHSSLSKPRKTELSDEALRQKLKEEQLNERRVRLKALLEEDEKSYEAERKRRVSTDTTRTDNEFFPEIALLKKQLTDLRSKNEEESQKLNQKLAYESWKKSHPVARQMEAERFKHFVKEAWVDQKKDKELRWKEEQEAVEKAEREALEEAQRKEEEERKEIEKKKQQLTEWRVQLDQQLSIMREKEEVTEALRTEEALLEKEKSQLEEIERKQLQAQNLRKRKDMECSWAKQYHMKLKRKAKCIQENLEADEAVIEDLLRVIPVASADEKKRRQREESTWMKTVIQEQQKLEKLREKEHELLFSEEAKVMWQKREAEWEREQKARDKLMSDVLSGLQEQVIQKLDDIMTQRSALEDQKKELQLSLSEMSRLIEVTTSEVSAPKQPSKAKPKDILKVLEEKEQVRQRKLEEEQQLAEHRLEIARLEQQMKELWGTHYAPPHHGRKKVVW